jgi:hypothetical protein
MELLSPQRALEDIPQRIKRMHLRLMRFHYSVEYFSDSQLYTAYTLWRFPLSSEPTLINTSDVVEQYISTIVDALRITDVMIDKVLSASAADNNLQRIVKFCNTEWPDKVELLPPEVRPFWHSRN